MNLCKHNCINSSQMSVFFCACLLFILGCDETSRPGSRVPDDQHPPTLSNNGISYGSSSIEFADHPDPETAFNNNAVARLVKSAVAGDSSSVRNLLLQGVDVNSRGQQNITPAYFAIKARQKQTYALLLESGADPNIIYNQSICATTLAARYAEDSEWLELTLKHGGDPNVEDGPRSAYPGATPLHYAVVDGDIESVRMLLNNGANVNQKDDGGVTALREAIQSNEFSNAWLLLENNADPFIDGPDGNGISKILPAMAVPDDPIQAADRQKIIALLKLKRGSMP